MPTTSPSAIPFETPGSLRVLSGPRFTTVALCSVVLVLVGMIVVAATMLFSSLRTHSSVDAAARAHFGVESVKVRESVAHVTWTNADGTHCWAGWDGPDDAPVFSEAVCGRP